MSENTTSQNNLAVIDHDKLLAKDQQYLAKKSAEWINSITAIDANDFKNITLLEAQLTLLGLDIQQDLNQLSEAMAEPLERQISDSHPAARVLNVFSQLQLQLTAIKPPQAKTTLIERFLLLFSLRENRWQMWFDEYQTLRADIKKDLQRLEQLYKKVKAENLLLKSHHNKLAKCIQKLEGLIDLVGDVAQSLPAQHPHSETMDMVVKRQTNLQETLLIARQQLLSVELFLDKNNHLMSETVNASQHTTTILDTTAQLVVLNKLGNPKQLGEYATRIGSDADTGQVSKEANELINDVVYQLAQIKQ